jgi:hypothetical protein
MAWHRNDDAPLTIEQAGRIVDTMILPVLKNISYNGASEEVHQGEVTTPAGIFCWEASTHGSYGYVYLAVWLQPQQDGE